MDVDARESDEDFDFSRVVALTDGVFAIAATLLVLGLSAPTTDVDLTQRLLDQSDNLFAYALSFAVIGRLWVTHHNFFKVLRRFDSLSIALNLVYLAWIALIPFASQFLGNVGHSAQAVIVYAACLVGVGLTFGAEVRSGLPAGSDRLRGARRGPHADRAGDVRGGDLLSHLDAGRAHQPVGGDRDLAGKHRGAAAVRRPRGVVCDRRLRQPASSVSRSRHACSSSSHTVTATTPAPIARPSGRADRGWRACRRAGACPRAPRARHADGAAIRASVRSLSRTVLAVVATALAHERTAQTAATVTISTPMPATKR